MAIRKTIQIGNPILKAKNRKVTDFKSIKQIIKDLEDTMRKEELIGMAAPQIGENYKIFVTEPKKTEFRELDQADKLRVFINPKVVRFSKKKSIIYEGCGSVVNADLFGPVKRSKQITIEAYDENENKFSLRCDGILARVILHEYDHLFGIEFTEKIYDYRELMNYEFYKKSIRKSKEQTKASAITVNEYKQL